MGTSPGTAHDSAIGRESAEDRGWTIILAAAEAADECEQSGRSRSFAVGDAGVRPVADSDRDAAITWRPQDGWMARLPDAHVCRPLIDLYLPICSATKARPVTVGHLGQSLDGFIATHTGDSQFVTGPENLKHMHRMRALCDAIVVGAGTVAADDPQLTTRHVAGSNPTRVIIDPTRRLADHYRVFSDDAVETIVVCGRSFVQPDELTFGRATIVALDDCDGSVNAATVLALLRARGCHRIFVEGGGVTVSMFLEANLLDRLQVAIAPLIIGDGRPAIRLQQPPAALGDCHRPRYRVFRMGGDILFDCDLRASTSDVVAPPTDSGSLSRVL